MGRRRRVLLQAPLPPPSGGIATWTHNLLNSPLAEEFDIRVVDINAGALDVAPGQVARRKALIAGRAIAQFTMEIARFRPDVVHLCTSAHARGLIRDTPGLHLAKASGAATVLHVHGSAARLGKRASLLPILRRMLEPVDALVVLNEDSLMHALSYGFSPVHRIPNSIESRPLPTREWPPIDRSVRFLFVGWLMPAKGVFDLLEAFKQVPDAELTLLGRWTTDDQGVVRDAEVEELLQTPELMGRVHIPGEVPLEEVWAHYDRADVFVLPSWTEGFPMTLLESMMAGLPSVVSRVGAMPEAVVHGTSGFVVEPKDVAGLRAALQQVVAQRDQIPAWGAAARERVMTNYTHEVVHAQLARLWNTLR